MHAKDRFFLKSAERMYFEKRARLKYSKYYYRFFVFFFFRMLIDWQPRESCVQIWFGDEFRADSLTFSG